MDIARQGQPSSSPEPPLDTTKAIPLPVPSLEDDDATEMSKIVKSAPTIDKDDPEDAISRLAPESFDAGHPV
jgi:hypothetical protein